MNIEHFTFNENALLGLEINIRNYIFTKNPYQNYLSIDNYTARKFLPSFNSKPKMIILL